MTGNRPQLPYYNWIPRVDAREEICLWYVAGVEHRRRVRNIDGGCGTLTAGAEHWALSIIDGGCKGIDSGCGSIDCGCRSIDCGCTSINGGCGNIDGNGGAQSKDDWRAKSEEWRVESEVELRRKDHQDIRNNTRRTTMQYAVTLQDEECSKAEVFEGGGVTEVPKMMKTRRNNN